MTMARTGSTALLAVLALLVSSCASADRSAPPTPGQDAASSAPPFDVSGYEAEMLRLGGVDGLSGALARVSAAIFTELAIGAQYQPPTAVVRFKGAGITTGCGSVRPLDAAYCRDDSSIAVDEELLRRAYGFFQATGPMLILAHEWGHHLVAQASLSRLNVAEELMADCLAGLFMARHFPVAFGQPDHRSAAALLFVLGDERVGGSPWFDPTTHGDPAHRVRAFLAGLGGSPSLCSDYWSWQPIEPMEIGGYQWLPTPSGEVERSSGNAVILYATERFAAMQAGPASAHSAMVLLPEAFAATVGGRGQLIGPPVELPMQSGPAGQLGGTAAAQAYAVVENGAPAGRGVFFVHLSTTGEALLVRSYDAGVPANVGLAAGEWAPLRDWTMGIIGGLCPPDGSGILCESIGPP
jgi:hypothetical protein